MVSVDGAEVFVSVGGLYFDASCLYFAHEYFGRLGGVERVLRGYSGELVGDGQEAFPFGKREEEV